MDAPPAPQARRLGEAGTGAAAGFWDGQDEPGTPWRFTLTATVTLTIMYWSHEPRCGRSPGRPGTPRIGRSGRSHHGQPIGWPPHVFGREDVDSASGPAS